MAETCSSLESQTNCRPSITRSGASTAAKPTQRLCRFSKSVKVATARIYRGTPPCALSEDVLFTGRLHLGHLFTRAVRTFTDPPRRLLRNDGEARAWHAGRE